MSNEQNKPGFTPGPWKILRGYLLTEDGNERIPKNEANAHLIATSPKLYEFIRLIEDIGTILPEYLQDQATELLAQARGETQP